MKNLKKVLCLVLTIAMMMSMMIFTASAANFTDNSEIVNTEAVNTMNALNIINGKGDGSYFDPTGIVTRAEMAKMICVALNGGKDPQLGTTAYSFTDTVGNWAAGYIEYCYNLGIIAGRGDGTFDPTGTVTGTEAAKMLLVAIGYDAANEGFTGASWAIAVNVRANQKNFYEELSSMNPSAGLTRDNAAQMVYNAINAVKVEYSYSLSTVNGTLQSVAVVKDSTAAANTILLDKFSAVTTKAVMVDVSYDSDSSKYTYTFDTDFATYIASPTTPVLTFTSKTDYTAFYGQYVKTISKTTTSGVVAYGVYSLSNKVITTTVGSITAGSVNTKVKVSGTSYDLELTDATTPIYNAVAATTTENLSTMTASPKTTAYDVASTLILVADSTNSKIDWAVVIPVTVAKVTYSGATSITAGANYTYTANTIESGLVKGDFVSVVPAANSYKGKTTITKIDSVSGTLDGLNGTKALIGGAWYSYAANAGDTLTLGESYDLAVVGSYYYNATQTSSGGSVSNMIYVSGAVAKTTIQKVQAKIYTTDGTSSVVSVYSVGGTADAVPANGLYTYTLDTNGYYKLTAVSGTNKLGYAAYDATVTSYTAATSTTDAKLGTYTISDDAVIFLAYGGGVKVLTGKTVNDWSASPTFGTSNLLTKSVNGLSVVMAGLVTTADAAAPVETGATGNYGYVVSTPYQIIDGSYTYWTYQIWNGSEVVPVIEKNTGAANVAQRDVIQYNDLGSGYITYVATASSGAITGYSTKSLNVAASTGAVTSYALADTTKYLYVDSTTATGVASGEMALSALNADGSRVQNVYVINGATSAKLVVYEINNKIVNSTGAAIASCGYAVAVPTIATAPAGWTIAADKTVACQGDTVTLTLVTNGTGAQTSAAIVATGAASVTTPVTLVASTAATYTATVTMGAAAVTAITATLS